MDVWLKLESSQNVRRQLEPRRLELFSQNHRFEIRRSCDDRVVQVRREKSRASFYLRYLALV
jgi:hypothetical protein